MKSPSHFYFLATQILIALSALLEISGQSLRHSCLGQILSSIELLGMLILNLHYLNLNFHYHSRKKLCPCCFCLYSHIFVYIPRLQYKLIFNFYLDARFSPQGGLLHLFASGTTDSWNKLSILGFTALFHLQLCWTC